MNEAAAVGEQVVGGVRVPPFFYGTAWKEEATEGLVREALAAGFRGFDTAGQRKHYHEAAVGAALRAALAAGEVRREELFVQTKFTHLAGQDHRLPYDPAAPVATQVRQSFARSLEHLGVERLDSLVLHGPCVRVGLHPDDEAAWEAMQGIHAEGGARLLGVSNVSREQLVAFCERGPVPPAFVQNRCFAALGWDAEVRAECRARGIVYQGFSLLTANRREIDRPAIAKAAARLGATPEQVVFRFALEVGMLPLTGTSDPRHMREDLAVLHARFALTPEEREAIEGVGLHGRP
ncbi:MAG: aldo/keto reductase [Planctomycetota bacterium]|nr:MAG: aldo/keto reductase [Planctomycetota bacterium]